METLNVNDEFEFAINGKKITVKYDGVSLFPAMLKFSFYGDAISTSGTKTINYAVNKFKELRFQDYIECGYVLAKKLQSEFFNTPPLLTTKHIRRNELNKQAKF